MNGTDKKTGLWKQEKVAVTSGENMLELSIKLVTLHGLYVIL